MSDRGSTEGYGELRTMPHDLYHYKRDVTSECHQEDCVITRGMLIGLLPLARSCDSLKASCRLTQSTHT